LQGVPEIVIEVLSPSNTASEMLDREQICLENGRANSVPSILYVAGKSLDSGRPLRSYESGQEIPLLFGGSLAVDWIFA
jgi:hypothetical protein